MPSYFPAVRYGGPIYSVHGLVRGLAERGHEVHVYTTNVNGSGISDVPLGQPVDLEGVKVWYFPVTWPRRLYRAPKLVSRLRPMLSRNAVVHLHSVFLWPTWASATSSLSAKTAYVVSPRGMLVKALIRKRSRAIKSAWIRLIERSNLERASAIHLTSQLEATELERFRWKLPRCVVIPNGVEDPLARTGQVAEDIRTITAAQPLVLFLGRLSWKKGLDQLLGAFARIRGGALAIVGTDDEGLAPKLRMLAADLGITDRVCILPRTVIGVEREHLFAAARLFVLSSYSENFGNTVLEAMRRGIPIVTTPEVGAADIVQRSGGGIVTRSAQEPLGHAMDRFLQDANLARSMGEAGQRYVIANYSWSRIAAQMEGLYQSLHS